MEAAAVLAYVEKSRQAARQRAADQAARQEEEQLAAENRAFALAAATRARIDYDALWMAITDCDDESAALLAPTVKPELVDQPVSEDGRTVLHAAASRGLHSCCRALLGRDDVQPKVATLLRLGDSRGWTPLHCAAACTGENAELVIRLLVEGQGTTLSALDHAGRTPLKVACEWGLSEAAVILRELADQRRAGKPATAASRGNGRRSPAEQLAAGLTPSGPGSEAGEGGLAGEGPAVVPEVDLKASAGIDLVNAGRLEEAVALVNHPDWPFVNERNSYGRTLLHLAAARGSAPLCEAVLDRMDFELADAVDKDQATALHLAAANRRAECCAAILESELFTAVNAQDVQNRTALHLAALRGDAACYDAILAHEACDSKLRDGRQRTAHDYGRERGLGAPPDAGALGELGDPALEIEL